MMMAGIDAAIADADGRGRSSAFAHDATDVAVVPKMAKLPAMAANVDATVTLALAAMVGEAADEQRHLSTPTRDTQRLVRRSQWPPRCRQQGRR